MKDATGLNTVSSYTYTPAGLMSVATYHDKSGTQRTLTNTWDADSNRVRLSDGTTQWTYTYDPTASIPAVLVEDDGSGYPVYYFREPDGALVSRKKVGVSGPGSLYYLFDELGSTRMLVSNAQVSTDSYTYDAYGNAITHEAKASYMNFPMTTDNPYQYVGHLGYYTHYMAPDFGLLQLGVRFYDPEVGRFTQSDPSGYGSNHYSYVDGNPVLLVDPLGLWPWGGWYGDQCAQLAVDIRKAVAELQKRYKEMLEDKYHMYDTYCQDSTKLVYDGSGNLVGNWVGHQQQYVNWQNRLRNKLEDWAKNKCWCSPYKIPEHGTCLKSTGPPRMSAKAMPGKPCTPKKGPVSPY